MYGSLRLKLIKNLIINVSTGLLSGIVERDLQSCSHEYQDLQSYNAVLTFFPHHRCLYSMVLDCKSNTTEARNPTQLTELKSVITRWLFSRKFP